MILNNSFKKDLELSNPIKLNIGSGTSSLPGFYNLDVVALPNVDIVADINLPLTDIPSNSVCEIYARHTLEHVNNLLGLLSEFHRISTDGAIIKITVPHFSNPYYYSDPTHVRPFGLYSMHYFMETEDQPVKKLPNYYTNTRFKLVSIKYDFYRESPLEKIFVPILRPLVNINYHTQAIYEKRFPWFWPASELRFILSVSKK